jgi:hypothetical protein
MMARKRVQEKTLTGLIAPISRPDDVPLLAEGRNQSIK